jgi:hypothetical protein
MRSITFIVVSVLLVTLGLAAGCTKHNTVGEPLATRPSLTVFPIQMAGHPREDVAAMVALLLEKSGMESIEVDGAVFSPDVGASFDDQAGAFAAFVTERDLSTKYALYGAVIGSPQRGVDEIHAVLVDAGGNVAWSDRQTRESRAFKQAKPADPMSCTVFLVERLRDPLDLLDPTRADAPEGKWADYWQKDSLVPTDAERDEMQERLARLLDAAPAATVLVYPARIGDSWSIECANRLAERVNRRGLLRASVAENAIEFEIKPSGNQQKVLWSGARSIRELLRANSPGTQYVLLADYMLPGGGRGGEARGVHTFLLEADGDWVIVDFQNSHHDDFNRIHPSSHDECCDLTVVRLARYLGS